MLGGVLLGAKLKERQKHEPAVDGESLFDFRLLDGQKARTLSFISEVRLINPCVCVNCRRLRHEQSELAPRACSNDPLLPHPADW